MQLMLELTRRCDMQCRHCLRGDAQGVDMSDCIMRTAINKFSDVVSSFSFGGGEAILKPELIDRFRQNLIWSGVSSNYLEPMWIVSNGKRLLRQEDLALYPNETNYDSEEEEVCYKNTPIVESLMKLSWSMPITLAISTDQFHDDGMLERFNHVNYVFENEDNIEVVKHGPSSYNHLISMGRHNGGKYLEINSPEDDQLYYVNTDGDVYTSCDLSYTFMKEFKDTFLCLGNVNTNSLEEIESNRDKLSWICEEAEGHYIEVAEGYTGELEELTEKYHNENKNS